MQKMSAHWLWLSCLVALPFYQLIGTIRHELSHASVALGQGATLTKFVFWPSWQHDQLLWGYVRWTGGHTTWLTGAAPYINDLIVALVCASLLYYFRRGRRTHSWMWWNGLILGVASPLVNSGYAYVRHFFISNDVSKLYTALPTPVIHGYFLVTLGLYLILIWRLLVTTKA